MLGHTTKAIFSTVLEGLGAELVLQSENKLSRATYHDTVEGDDGNESSQGEERDADAPLELYCVRISASVNM